EADDGAVGTGLGGVGGLRIADVQGLPRNDVRRIDAAGRIDVLLVPVVGEAASRHPAVGETLREREINAVVRLIVSVAVRVDVAGRRVDSVPDPVQRRAV